MIFYKYTPHPSAAQIKENATYFSIRDKFISLVKYSGFKLIELYNSKNQGYYVLTCKVCGEQKANSMGYASKKYIKRNVEYIECNECTKIRMELKIFDFLRNARCEHLDTRKGRDNKYRSQIATLRCKNCGDIFELTFETMMNNHTGYSCNNCVKRYYKVWREVNKKKQLERKQLIEQKYGTTLAHIPYNARFPLPFGEIETLLFLTKGKTKDLIKYIYSSFRPDFMKAPFSRENLEIDIVVELKNGRYVFIEYNDRKHYFKMREFDDGKRLVDNSEYHKFKYEASLKVNVPLFMVWEREFKKNTKEVVLKLYKLLIAHASLPPLINNKVYESIKQIYKV